MDENLRAVAEAIFERREATYVGDRLGVRSGIRQELFLLVFDIATSVSRLDPTFDEHEFINLALYNDFVPFVENNNGTFEDGK